MATRKSTPRFTTQERFVLPGSEKAPFTPSTGEQVKPATGKVTVSVIIRRKEPLPPHTPEAPRLTRAQYRQRHAADAAAAKLVRAFAAEYGLTEPPSEPKPERRTIHLTGSVAAMQKAFGVTLLSRKLDGQTFRVREGSIQLPKELEGSVDAVLGLDNRPQASPHFRIAGAATPASGNGNLASRAAAAGSSFTPVQIAQLYQWPANPTAAGQTIGIIELGGGYRTADITAYFKTLGQKAPKVTAVSVDGGKNSPSNAQGADGEVMLDIEVAAAVAPGANIVVYFAPNTDQGFIDAVANAVHDTKNQPSVISISWGGPESGWTAQSLNAFDAACQSAAALGVTITAAAGDNGSTDGGTGNNVDFPASSPHILACGGTKLVGTGSTISSEVVWNEQANNEGATGGGVSNFFDKPAWQNNANVPPSGTRAGRGVPDVAGDADPTTGYTIRVDGQTMVIGGTSAVAPLWAGLIAVANARNKKSAGFINPVIYNSTARPGFRDITEGNNGAFSAGPGWDACTGLGSPIASALIPLLAPSTTVKPPKKGKKTTSTTSATTKTPPKKAAKKVVKKAAKR